MLISPRVFLDTVLYVQTTYQDQNNLLHWKHNSRFFFLSSAFNTEKYLLEINYSLIRSLAHTHFSRTNMILILKCAQAGIRINFAISIPWSWHQNIPICTHRRRVKKVSVDTPQEAYSVAHSMLHHKTGNTLTDGSLGCLWCEELKPVHMRSVSWGALNLLMVFVQHYSVLFTMLFRSCWRWELYLLNKGPLCPLLWQSSYI